MSSKFELILFILETNKLQIMIVLTKCVKKVIIKTKVIISLPNREALKVPIKISPYGYIISTEWTVLQGLTLKIKSISTARTYRVI